MRNKAAMQSKDRKGEDWLLRKIALALRTDSRRSQVGIRLAIGDDAALWRPRFGYEAILTCDWFLEDVHFLREKHPADAIGWKCLARALSDVAAMGGMPKCFLLSLAIPETHIGDWLDKFLGGLRRASRHFQCPAAGGDTTRNNKILISVTVVGDTKAGRAPLRSGARPGDHLYVSGRLGEAELGWRELKQTRNASRRLSACVRKHLYPEPRLALGLWLANQDLPTAMMDVSDGLSTDLARLCEASAVGAVIEEKEVPLARFANRKERQTISILNAALHGGDDYELLFSVPANKARRIPRRIAGTRLTRIGTITPSRTIDLVHEDGSKEPLRPQGWDPFRIP